jgi:phage shock protein C
MADRLYRSRRERVIAGVAGGLGDLLGIDPTLIRVVWAVLAVLSGGIFVVIYIVMAIIVPEERWATTDVGRGDRYAANPTAGPSDDTTSVPTPGAAAPGAPNVASGTTAGQSAAGAGWRDWRDDRRDADGHPRSWRRERRRDGGGGLIVGIILMLVGAWFLLREYVPQIDTEALWPLLAVGAGILLIVLSIRPNRSSE